MYGHSIASIDDLDGDHVREIVVGASGDQLHAPISGAIYVLMMKADGTVKRHIKIGPGSDNGLKRQMVGIRGFGTSLQEVDDLDGDGIQELAVGSKNGTTTLLFLNREGELKAGLHFNAASSTDSNRYSNADVWNERELKGNIMKLAEPPRQAGSARGLASTRDASVKSSQCFFNDTACQCELKSAVVGSQTCYDEAGSDAFGHTLCRARDCRPSYTCSCDGPKYCERKRETQTIFSYHGPYSGGKVLCHRERVTRDITTLVPGAQIPLSPVESPAVVLGGLNGYNDTHCLCSFKKDVVGAPTCLDFSRVVATSAIICTTRPCRIKEDDVVCDMGGKMLCSHKEVTTKVFVNNGPVPGRPGEVYCHEQSSPWDKTIRT